jgi:hypothetical protein
MTRPIELRGTAKLPSRDSVRRQLSRGLFHLGVQFIAAAYELKNKDPLRTVRTYLVGHATELFLKSFLLTKGVSPKKVREKYGHNLEKLLEAALAHDFAEICPISREVRAQLKALNGLYQGKQFEYFDLAHFFGGVTVEIDYLLAFLEQTLQPLFEVVDKFSATSPVQRA